MKKRILSVFAAGAVLFGTVSGSIAAEAAEFSPRASLVLDETTGYLVGADSVPTADFIAAQYTGDVTVTAPGGEVLTGDALVPADSVVKDGTIEIARVAVPGDASRDAKIDLSDITAVLKSIAGWDIEISEPSADANGNGTVDLTDVTAILKYIAEWDVTLGVSVDLAPVKDGSAEYVLLSNDADSDSAVLDAVQSYTGALLETVTEEVEGKNYITAGVGLWEKYDFLGDSAEAIEDDDVYVDTYEGNIYLTAKSAEALASGVEYIAAGAEDGSLVIPRGYAGSMYGMTEEGALYRAAYKNLLASEPVTDGTNGMNEDIYIAVSNATYTKPKNIIFMIGDGMGKNIATAAEYCRKGDLYNGTLAVNYMPNEGLQSTYSADYQVTDSAAGGTALSTGYKTANSVVAKNKDMTGEYKTLLELASEKGKSTGIIATKSVTDATPATFTAHVNDRGEEVEIARQQLVKLSDGTLDVILGGGSDFYNDAENTETLSAAVSSGLTYTDNWETAVSAELPLAGIFTPREMSTDAGSDEPHIAAMTDLALDLLSDDEDGFFLMVEGSKIDTWGHANDFGAEVDEMYEFDCAVAVAMRYIALNPDTALIITADHETGELAIPATPTVDNIRSNSRYSTAAHHWVDVPVYSAGYGTEALLGNMENTDIAIFMAGLMGEEDFGQRSEVYTLFDLTDKTNTDAILEMNKDSAGITVGGGKLSVKFGKEGTQRLYLPIEEFDVTGEALETVTAVRVTYTNTSDRPKTLPSLGLKGTNGSFKVYERITYLDPGETMTYTYVSPENWRHTGSLSEITELTIYSSAGYSADMQISDISVVTRPLDK